MEKNWVSPSSNKDEIKKISDYAFDNLNVPTPTKEVLDEDTKEYIEARFPKDNDNNMQEAISQKFIIDSGFQDTLSRNEEFGEDIQKKISENLWSQYHKLLQEGSYIDILNDVNKNSRHLRDKLKILQIQSELNINFKLNKSGISNEEAKLLLEQEINLINEELSKRSEPQLSSQSMEELLVNYDKMLNKYNEINSILNPKDPSMN